MIRRMLLIAVFTACESSVGIAQENTESVRRYNTWVLAAGNIGIGAMASGLSRLLVGEPPVRAARSILREKSRTAA